MNKLLEWFFPSVIKRYRAEGYEFAIKDILILKDKVCFGDISIVGDNSTVENMTSIGGKVGISVIGKGSTFTNNAVWHCDLGINIDSVSDSDELKNLSFVGREPPKE